MVEQRPRADAERDAATSPEPRERRGPAPVLRGVALWLLGVGAVALVYNLVTTLRTLDRYPGARFGEVFLATDGDDALSTAWFHTIVWGPPALLALAAAVLLISLLPALRRGRAARR